MSFVTEKKVVLHVGLPISDSTISIHPALKVHYLPHIHLCVWLKTFIVFDHTLPLEWTHLSIAFQAGLGEP